VTRFKAVAWDIDGTLVDSEGLHHRALIETCRRYGADLSGLPDRAFQGVHMLDVWSRLRPLLPGSLDRSEWLAAIERFYIERAGELVATPQAQETMRALHARGLAQGCVSNSARRVVDANIAALGIGDLIAFSISLDDVAAGKPDPEPYRRAAQLFGLGGHEVIAVEDSAAGAASAKAAGLYVARYAPDGERDGAGDCWLGKLPDMLDLLEADVDRR
jgi:HAD superfamily hydrolase (TIGR01509 family)